jgi:hypothetical protein
MTLAVWLALLPLRLLAALGLRRSLILTCLFVLTGDRLRGSRRTWGCSTRRPAPSRPTQPG